MASTVPVLLLLLFVGFLTTTLADNDCKGYISSDGRLRPSIDCRFPQFCCGTCDNRYCCYNIMDKLSEDDQEQCFFNDNKNIIIGVTITGIVIFIVVFLVCCVCPCCCIYKMCRKPRPVAGAMATTTVISTQYPQQPMAQGGQYPPYQPMPPQAGYGTAPGYGATPMPTAPYQGQPYSPGPPPPYQEAGGPGYPVPYSQAAFDGGHASYPIQPPVQPGFTHPPQPTDYHSAQPAYNPAYMEPPKTGY